MYTFVGEAFFVLMKKHSDTRLLLTGFLLIHVGVCVLILLLRLSHTFMSKYTDLGAASRISLFSLLIVLAFLYTVRVFAWFKLWAVPRSHYPLMFYYRCKRMGLILDTSDDRVALVNSLSFFPRKRFELLEKHLAAAREQFQLTIPHTTFDFDKDKWRLSLFALLQALGMAAGIYLVIYSNESHSRIIGLLWACFTGWYLARNLRLLASPNPVFSFSPAGIRVYPKENISWQQIGSIQINTADYSLYNKMWIEVTYTEGDKTKVWKQNITNFTRNPFEIVDIFAHFAPGSILPGPVA